jgi:hypothetical protein
MSVSFIAATLALFLISGAPALIWLFAFVYSSLSGSFRHRGFGEAPDNLTVIFQITTRDCPVTISSAISSVHAGCASAGLRSYYIWVVTEPANKKWISPDNYVRRLAVPYAFYPSPQPKARALEYSRSVRLRERFDGWIYLMDEENTISAQTVSAIVAFANSKRALLASGPLVFDRGLKVFPWLVDSIRGSHCRVCHLYHSLGWFPCHGENLLLHTSLERSVSWITHSLTEDFVFSARARRLGYKSGWHGGVLVSSSPHTIRDLIRQRRRWYWGFLQSAADNGLLIKHRLMALSLYLSPLLALLSISAVALGISTHRLFLVYATGILVVVSAGYYLGCPGSAASRLAAAVLCPVSLLMESVAAILAALRPPKTFEVIEKVAYYDQRQL